MNLLEKTSARSSGLDEYTDDSFGLRVSCVNGIIVVGAFLVGDGVWGGLGVGGERTTGGSSLS